MNRICRHAVKIQEMWRSAQPTPTEDIPPHIVGDDERMRYAGWEQVVDIDDNDPSNWQCGWLSTHAHVPAPITRSAGSNYLKAGECDVCPCFEPVALAIPGAVR